VADHVTVVMLAWGDEPLLAEAVSAALASTGVDVDIIVVDNGSPAVDAVRGTDGVTVLSPGRNLGFAGGCNLGASRASGDVVAFVNSDAIVGPTALAALADALVGDVALVSGSVRLRGRPDVINSAGNPVHYAGLSWAGGLGASASDFAAGREIASASGALCAMTATRFAEIGGFCEPMFAYLEDADLSLRCWLRGWRVRYVPEAIATHHYEFGRNPQKLFLLERNRLFMVLTVWPTPLLLALSPALFGLEFAMALVSVRDGWARQKAAGWWWTIRNLGLVVRRRRSVQSTRAIPAGRFADLLTADFSPGESLGLSVPAFARTISRAYWKLARRAL